MDSSQYAIATVTDNSFIRGTTVLLFSFFEYNPWFQGDVIIIENDLTEANKRLLSIFPNIKFKRINKELLTRIKIVAYYKERFKYIGSRFFSLEAFDLREYDKILFLDSDILCCDSLYFLFNLNDAGFYAAPDKQYYLGKKRELYSFLPQSSFPLSSEKVFIKSFNSGVMLINNLILDETVYFKLLELLNPLFFRPSLSGHSDQYLLNHYFLENVTFLSYQYNYLLNSKQDFEKQNKYLKDALLIHYVGDNKPWQKITEKLKDMTQSHFVLWKKTEEEFEYLANEKV